MDIRSDIESVPAVHQKKNQIFDSFQIYHVYHVSSLIGRYWGRCGVCVRMWGICRRGGGCYCVSGVYENRCVGVNARCRAYIVVVMFIVKCLFPHQRAHE